MPEESTTGRRAALEIERSLAKESDHIAERLRVENEHRSAAWQGWSVKDKWNKNALPSTASACSKERKESLSE